MGALILLVILCSIFGIVYPVIMAMIWAAERMNGSTESFKSYMSKI